MKACIVASVQPAAAHQRGWGGCFAHGLRRHGWEAKVSPVAEPCDLLVLWGVRKQDAIRAQRKAKGAICILERGYLADRFTWASVSFGGGLNGRGKFYGPLDDPSRWEKHFAGLMKPWRGVRSGYALILGQVPHDMSLRGLWPGDVWFNAATRLRQAGWDVQFRRHPNAPGLVIPGVAFRPTEETLEEALRGAGMALAINSNASVESVLAGVPTVTLDDRAMAWPVTGHEPAYPPSPDRTAWAHAMAWKQWTMAEMASGECWAHVGGGFALDQAA